MQLKMVIALLFFATLNLSCQDSKKGSFYIFEISNYNSEVYVSDTSFYKNKFLEYKQITPKIKREVVDSLVQQIIYPVRLKRGIEDKEVITLTVGFDYQGYIDNVSFILKKGSHILPEDLGSLQKALEVDGLNIFDFDYTGILNRNTKYITRVRVPLAAYLGEK